ncbi:MAG: excinuclease ABC subunit B [Chloroflexi bacterium]|nr:excinuclease ABC subunit B [Chloroflexota bacterium]
MGDQPSAIESLSNGIKKGLKHQTLLGVTGSGKTFTMAGIIENCQRPTLVIAHNKTLAAQLTTELQEIFPDNSVQYFVSYYDYYQPEAYIPRTDTFIEKDADINEEIDRLRHAATRSLLTRNDTLIVASVSCIYGLGSPEEYKSISLKLKKGDTTGLRKISRRLTEMFYERNDFETKRGNFKIKGDTLEIIPAYEEFGIRIQFFGDEIDQMNEIDSLTGEVLSDPDEINVYPAKHFVTPTEQFQDALGDIEEELDQSVDNFHNSGKLLEAQRIQQRTKYDLELLRETGTCPGVENYSRPLGRRQPGSAPWTLLDYFPEDLLIFIDESHMTIPQIRGMFAGDLARKTTLVEYGFRLPSAIDNRPLSFPEFEERINQIVYVSATPGPYEIKMQEFRAEQIIRPTGLVDPKIYIKPTLGQIDDLFERIKVVTKRNERTLITTLTKKMSEELADYMTEMGIKVHYLHSEIDTIKRSEILRDLRLGIYDVVIGINLLREGIDLPEVSLVAILDADKEGYLRSETALIQTMGRAARHVDGTVIMYADKVTGSMTRAIEETERRRIIQTSYNKENHIMPKSIVKEVHDITQRIRKTSSKGPYNSSFANISKKDLLVFIKDLEKEMKNSARDLEFEKAAVLRDQITDCRKILLSKDTVE